MPVVDLLASMTAAIAVVAMPVSDRVLMTASLCLPFLPALPSPLTLSLLPLSTPAGTLRLIFLVRLTLPSPPQVLQGVALSPLPSQSGHVETCT